MKIRFSKYFYVLIFLFPFSLTGQNWIVTGRITDEQTSDPLSFVNIGIKGEQKGTFTDVNGYFTLETGKGTFHLVITCVGYEKVEMSITVDQPKVILNLSLTNISNELSTVVVSVSRYAQKIQESISSIEVMKAASIETGNLQSIDKAVDRIPGVAIVNNEPQIRGGSGFSSGLGSRVMVMVDEMPLLRGDAGRPTWVMLPIDEVEQIEVVKGASSVIFGSSAINGVINVRTAWPKEKSETKINSFVSIYSKPERRYTTPWTGFNPLTAGISIFYSQQIDNKDIVVGGGYFTDQGYIGGVPERKAVDSVFNEGQYDKRIKFYFNTRIRSKNIEGLSFGINGNFLYSESAQTFFWFDSDTNIYRSYPGSLSLFKETSFYVDPYLKYFSKNGGSHIFRNRIYYSKSDADNNQSSGSVTIFDEYQFNHRFKKIGDLKLMTGVSNTYVYSNGQVFSGKLASNGTTTLGDYGTYTSENLAVYLQMEKKFFNRLNILLGGRYEYYHIEDFVDNRPVFRAGLNFQAGKGTFLRTSMGQGFRFPSIGERYITTNSGNFGFYPNPELKPEKSLSFEIGGKQLFRAGLLSGIIDLAYFSQKYENYIEFNFGYWGLDSLDVKKNVGFKFFNTGPASIKGVDVTGNFMFDFTKKMKLGVMLGYTYSVPKALDPHYVFYVSPNDPGKPLNYLTTSSDTVDHILKYRVQSLFKGDLQFTIGRFSTGFGGRYFGFIKNIDKFFGDIMDSQMFGVRTGITKYREQHNSGTFIIDFRAAVSMKNLKFSVIVNNVLNTEFSLRPLTMESPRTTQLQVIYKI